MPEVAWRYFSFIGPLEWHTVFSTAGQQLVYSATDLRTSPIDFELQASRQHTYPTRNSPIISSSVRNLTKGHHLFTAAGRRQWMGPISGLQQWTLLNHCHHMSQPFRPKVDTRNSPTVAKLQWASAMNNCFYSCQSASQLSPCMRL